MRADVYLAETGRFKSREAAKTAILSGWVVINGRTVAKPSEAVDGSTEHTVTVLAEEKYVSRGGLKLEAAIEGFDIDVGEMSALDIGASTGGFTDCLLQHGASSVVAIDSGRGQLDPSIASDPRVTAIEGFNAKGLSRELIPGGADIAVMDVSFISQTMIIPNLPDVMKPEALFVSLIKPQFEVGRANVGKGGIVRDRKARLLAVYRVVDAAANVGFSCVGLAVSPIKGGDGNIEYLACFKRGEKSIDRSFIEKIVR